MIACPIRARVTNLKLALRSRLSLEIGGGDFSSSSSSERLCLVLLGVVTVNLSEYYKMGIEKGPNY